MPVTECITISREASLLVCEFHHEYKFNQNDCPDPLPRLCEGQCVGDNITRERLHILDNHPRRATMRKLRAGCSLAV